MAQGSMQGREWDRYAAPMFFRTLPYSTKKTKVRRSDGCLGELSALGGRRFARGMFRIAQKFFYFFLAAWFSSD